jgi:hypothetical protein
MYHIKRQGNNWIVFRGWAIMASFSTKEEANAWVEWAKTQTVEAP